MDPEAFQTNAFQLNGFQVLLAVIGSFTFRIIGGPVMRATMSARGVLAARISGGAVLTETITGGMV